MLYSLKFLPKISKRVFFVWAVWMTLASIARNRRVLICALLFYLKCLAAAENQSQHKAREGKQVSCRFWALRLICGDEHGSIHAWLTWARSVVFGIHIAVTAIGEIAEAWPPLISTCKLTHARMRAETAWVGMQTTSSPLTCPRKREPQSTPF